MMRYAILSVSIYALVSCKESDPDVAPNPDAGDTATVDADATTTPRTDVGIDGSSGSNVDLGVTASDSGLDADQGQPDAANPNTIGKAGGTVSSPDGFAHLTVPEGKLEGDTKFLINRVSSATVRGIGSDVYDLGPDGSFDFDIEVCLTPTKDADTSQACLGYFDEKTKAWVCEDSCLDRSKGEYLCGQTNHFTNFAILLSGGSGKDDKCQDDFILGSGGKLTSPDNRAVLSIPERALPPEGKRITVSQPTRSDGKFGSAVYEFFPRGLTFAADTTLCIVPETGADTSEACLGYYDESEKTWKCEDVCLDRSKGEYLCGQTNHFTNFAILLSGGGSKGDACNDGWLSVTGGSVTGADGKTRLTVPADAVKTGVRFTIVETNLDAQKFGSRIYTLLPDASKFGKPVELCLPTSVSGSTDATCLGYQDSSGRWVCEDTCLESKDGLLCGQTDHFTNFAILLSGGSCK